MTRIHSHRPLLAGLLAAVAAAAALVLVRPATVSARQEALPTGRELADNHVAAIGGAAAYKAVKSMRVRGRFEMTAQNLAGDLEIVTARPDKLLLKVEVSGLGHLETGYDGTVGWSIDPLSGPAVLTGRQLKELQEDAWFDGTLHEPDHVREMTTVDKEEFARRPAYKVRVVFASGIEQFEYFDAETHFQIGTEGTRETPMGVLPTKSVLLDYKPFGALQQPTHVVQSAMGIEQAFVIASVVYNEVPDSAFAMPPAIKALIKN